MHVSDKREFLRCTLAAAGMGLAAVVLSLLLIEIAAPQVGLAASDPASSRAMAEFGRVANMPIEASSTMSITVFVPLVSYEEPPAPGVWRAEYYDNAILADDPTIEREDSAIDYDWGEGSPGSSLPDNYFSARWTGEWDFEVGVYTFFAYSDDGVRLWMGDDLLIDAWSAGMGEHEATITVDAAGTHRVKVEYFESRGDAAIQVRWRRTDLYPQWHGDYYDDPWVESGWTFERIDSAIQFDWGEGCPEELLDCVQFSVGWEATPVFEPGTQRINLFADEGYELYVDGVLVQHAGWDDGDPNDGAEDDWYDLYVGATGYREITYNFHDRGGPAEARLWIVNLAHPEWTAEYYDNTSLSGDPVAVEQEPAVFFDWGLGRPHRDLPRDNFSIRFSGDRYFHSGFYSFGLFADDGVRLRVDGELLVNQWHPGRAEYESPLTYLSSGYHEVIVEFLEYSGEAEIRYWWE